MESSREDHMSRIVVTITSVFFTFACGTGTQTTGEPCPDGCEDGQEDTMADVSAEDDPAVDPAADPALDPAMDTTDADLPGDPPVDVTEEDATDPATWPDDPAFADFGRAIWGNMAISAGHHFDPDRPQIVTIEDDDVWVQSRIVTDPTDPDSTPKLVHREVNPRTANASSPLHTSIGEVELERYHPTVPFITGIATVFHDVDGFSANQMIWQIQLDPTNSSTVERGGFTNSDGDSSHPALAASGTRILAVWRQDDGHGNSSLAHGIVDDTGAEIATGVVTGDDTQDLDMPELVSDGTGFGLAYVVHAGAGADRVEFLRLDTDGAVLSTSPISWTVTEPTSIIPLNTDRLDGSDPSGPALAWTGSTYLLVYEEASETGLAEDPSHLHTKVIDADGLTVLYENTIEDDIAAAASITITGRQQGMLDVAHNGRNAALVWVHDDTATGMHVWFMELGLKGRLLVSHDSPHNMNSSATGTFHPTLTWIQDEDDAWWVFAWVEFRSSSPPGHVTYTYSYGCEY